jgi:hypothetical protein
MSSDVAGSRAGCQVRFEVAVGDFERFLMVGKGASVATQQCYVRHVRAMLAELCDGGWLGRELARWQRLTGRSRGLCSAGFPVGCATPVAMVSMLRLQPPPVEPCMRFSRTRLTDVLHRRCSV